MDVYPNNTAWNKTTKYVVGVGVALLGVYALYLSSEVIPMLVIAILIAVITRPAIIWLHKRAHFPRGLAVAVTYLSALIIVPLILLLIIPAITNAVEYVLTLDYRAIFYGALNGLRNWLISVKAAQMPFGGMDAYVDQLVDELLITLQGTSTNGTVQVPSVNTIVQSLDSALTTTFSTITSLVGAVVSSVVVFIFIFLSSIYMSLSAHTYREAFLNAVPTVYRPEMTLLLGRLGRLWGSFFRGQLTLMLVIGTMSWLGLTILGVPGALSLGIIAGLLEMIPSAGPVIATIPAAIVALLQGSVYLPFSPLTMGIIVIGFYMLVQQVENNFIVPRVLGEAVELPPLVVITGVLVGASQFGILGALLATPVIATTREILRYIYRKILGEEPFPPEEETTGPKLPPLWSSIAGWVNKLKAKTHREIKDK